MLWKIAIAAAILLFAKSKTPNGGVPTQVIPLADGTGNNPTPNMGAISAASFSGGPNGCLECNAMGFGNDMTGINIQTPGSGAGNNAAGQGPSSGGGGAPAAFPTAPGDKGGQLSNGGGNGVMLFT